MEPLTPMLPEYPSEVIFSPAQLAKIDQVVRLRQARMKARKEYLDLRLQLIDLYSELIWVREQHLQLLTN